MHGTIIFLIALCVASLLLAIGWFARRKLPILHALFIPGSVVAGILGLCLFAPLTAMVEVPSLSAGQTEGLEWTFAAMLHAVNHNLKTWPKWLIAVVFAALLLERPSRSFRQSVRQAWQEGLVVWIVVLGQTTLGLVLTWLILKPIFGVPHAFGMLIETGFAGGHGTAAAMGEVFASPTVHLENGRDLGVMMATVGLIASVTTGIVYINIAARRGWTRRGDRLPGKVRPMPAQAQLPSEPLSVWLGQAALLMAAFFVGWTLQQASGWVANRVSPPNPSRDLTLAQVVDSFPLFIYTLFGGLIVRRVVTAIGLGERIHASILQRLVGVAMEFLVVAAIATLNVLAVAASAAPLLILIVAGLAWTMFCLFFVSRWLLPDGYWFELGILNYGMSTGTTATGFVLLRVVDPRLESGAAEDYALAAPLSSPFIGGGVLTLALPMLVLERSSSLAAPCLALLTIMAGIWLTAWRLKKKLRSS